MPFLVGLSEGVNGTLKGNSSRAGRHEANKSEGNKSEAQDVRPPEALVSTELPVASTSADQWRYRVWTHEFVPISTISIQGSTMT